MPTFTISALTPVVGAATAGHFRGRPGCLVFITFLSSLTSTPSL